MFEFVTQQEIQDGIFGARYFPKEWRRKDPVPDHLTKLTDETWEIQE
jgi:hypothetical protein